MCNLLEKDAWFDFDESCLQEFNILKEKLIQAPIMAVSNWGFPFEIMCDAIDFAVGVVLGQRKDKVFRAIYYGSRTLSEAQENYTSTEKECWQLRTLVISFALTSLDQKLWCLLIMLSSVTSWRRKKPSLISFGGYFSCKNST